MVVIAEGYATAVTLAKHGKGPTLAAYDSGNLLSVANAVHQRYPDKAIVIAGDDDHATENNPGREKALAAAEAVFKLVHKFDDPAPGNLLSNQKKTTTLEISLISLLRSFLDFSYYSCEAAEPQQKSPFSG